MRKLIHFKDKFDFVVFRAELDELIKSLFTNRFDDIVPQNRAVLILKILKRNSTIKHDLKVVHWALV